MRRGLVRALAFGLASLGSVGYAKPAVLTAQQMRAFGKEALVIGYADQALTVAEALLGRSPTDSSALALKAQALRVPSRLPQSGAAAKAARGTADITPLRYQTATVVGQALSLQGHRTMAQFWLRRAVQNTPCGAAQAHACQCGRVNAGGKLRAVALFTGRAAGCAVGGACLGHGEPDHLSGVFAGRCAGICAQQQQYLPL